MILKLRVVADGAHDDVAVDAEPDTTVGALARALFPLGAVDRPCSDLGLLVVDGPAARRLSPRLPIGRCGLRSGAEVRAADWRLGDPTPRPSATLHVLAGPDAPTTFRLPAGDSVIGRTELADVRLTDPAVSARHAIVRVRESVEVVDMGSANGVLVDGRRVGRRIVRPGDRLTLGDTTVAIAPDADCDPDQAHRPYVLFHRSPRVTPVVHAVRLDAPEVPRPPLPQRFPVATVLAPLLLAAVLLAVMQNLLSVLFFALSPLLSVAAWWEGRSSHRRQVTADAARFRASVTDLADRLSEAQALERAGRRREAPASIELLEAVADLAPSVWSRRPDDVGFGRLRLGTGRLASSVRVEIPAARDGLPGLWDELNGLVHRCTDVDDVPVVARLRDAIGVAGPDAVAAPAFRSLVTQLVALHAPGEVEIAALAPSGAWDWLAWLPHTTMLAGDESSGRVVVESIEATVDVRLARQRPEERSVPAVVLLVHDDAPFHRGRVVQIAERGRTVDVHVVWFASSLDRVPAACRTFVDVDPNTGLAVVGFADDGITVADVRPDVVGAEAALRMARRLSPVVDAGAPGAAATGLPSCVSLVDLVGDDVAVSPDAIAERWGRRNAATRDGLSAVVGATADGSLTLDLRRDGPHALVGGTTGSGKSEFLQAWILALAIEHPPERLNVLLVDYKGGAAFAECVRLPHCVGLVTDLRPHLVRRALASLDAEVRRREQLLADRRASSIVELEQQGDAPPNLVIVVDEFAALVAEVPEFVAGVVDIAQRGRSLGLHLILATQRPAGVVSDQVRANTNLRVALRMNDDADAIDVIGTPDAARFDPSLPGRASVSVGHGRTTTFQAAYTGGRSTGRHRGNRVRVSPLAAVCAPGRSAVSSERIVAPGGSDLVRVVEAVRAAASLTGAEAPRRPWLPELAARYCLERLPAPAGVGEFVIGVADDPGRQDQSPVAFRPDRDGNLAIYGTGGTGKSTALRSVAAAAGIATALHGPTWVYGLDFGTHGLELLTGLPHVGSIVRGDDDERVRRLIRHLDDELDRRSRAFAAVAAATLTDYRNRVDRDLARILLLVDHVGGLRNAYEGGPMHGWWERFVRIAAEGRGVGLHVVMTADRPAAIPAAVASAVQREIALRLANDVAALGAPTVAPDPGAPPGRGGLDGLAIQIAVPGGSPGLSDQAAALGRIAAEMPRIPDPPPIGSLPERVALSELPASREARPVVGVEDESLGPAAIPARGGFVIAGEAGSGVTTATETVVAAIERQPGAVELVLLGAGRSSLRETIPWAARAHGPLEVAGLAERLLTELDPADAGRVVVVVESVDDVIDTDAEHAVQRLVRMCRDLGVFVVAAGSTRSLSGHWPLLQTLTSYRSGIVLQPDQMDGDALFKVPFGRIRRTDFPRGRGVLVDGLRICPVQMAVPE